MEMATARAKLDHDGPTGGPDASDPQRNSLRELRQYAARRETALKAERQPYMADWMQVSDYVDPSRGRFNDATPSTTQGQQSARSRRVSRSKIINNAATLCVRTAAAGFASHMTSKSRPWFEVEAPGEGINDQYDVRVWTGEVTDELRATLAKSNFYKAMPDAYTEDIEFGACAILMPEDEEDVVRFHVLTIGTYCIGLGASGRVDTLYREFIRTARQLVDTYGEDALPKRVTDCMKRGRNPDQQFTVAALIEPNPDARPGMGPLGLQVEKFRPWREILWIGGGDSTEGCVKVKGYYEQPFAAARFMPCADETWSTSPCLDSLGDIKGLQYQEGQKLRVGDLLGKPPLGLPEAMKNKPASLDPGSRTYLPDNQVGTQASVLYQVQPQAHSVIGQSIAELRQRIEAALFYPLFLMLASLDDRDRTATEIAERRDERATVLGPTVEAVSDELLDPIIVRVFRVLERRGRIPPPPPVLADVPLKVEYTSILAQAMKASAIASIERTIGFVASMAKMTGDPSVFDKIDMDQAADEFSERTSAPATIVRSDEAVSQIRAGRAQAAQQQQLAAMAKPAADAAKAYQTLAETVPEDGSAAQALAAQLAGVPA